MNLISLLIQWLISFLKNLKSESKFLKNVKGRSKPTRELVWSMWVGKEKGKGEWSSEDPLLTTSAWWCITARKTLKLFEAPSTHSRPLDSPVVDDYMLMRGLEGFSCSYPIACFLECRLSDLQFLSFQKGFCCLLIELMMDCLISNHCNTGLVRRLCSSLPMWKDNWNTNCKANIIYCCKLHYAAAATFPCKVILNLTYRKSCLVFKSIAVPK